MSQLYDVWWKHGENEQKMEDSHQPFWRKVLAAVVEEDLQASSVLDIGCNQGGFLRFLYGERPFREGVGIDLARQSIEVATSRKGDLPIHYEATGDPEKYPERFDIAFSTSVLYLIEDLQEHAWKVQQALKPGGVYYSTYSDYNGNPSLPQIHKKINAGASLPMQLHTLDEITRAFQENGFDVAIARLQPDRFISLRNPDPWFQRVEERLLYEYEQAYIFRFTKR
ncbi:class I SAM-dependent methyltransferase [Brevibacillus sp. TJ4]|uniref:class I SAM-dependent methyltransferase n=1 Tax=Brevibacillus sp. TJ4 TaxID=3234853 RepID=UPI0037CE462E